MGQKRPQYEHYLVMQSRTCPKKAFSYLKRKTKADSIIPAIIP